MQTVTEITVTRNPQAFYCHFVDEAGIITKLDTGLYFMNPETGRVVAIEPQDCTWITVLGAVDVAMSQWVADMAAGGYAKKACSRLQEVA